MNPLTYHERTKHRLDGYAKGPDTLDWSMQPDPFRTYEGSKKTFLPLSAERLDISFSSLYGKPENIPASIESLGSLLQLSMAISAWKEYGPDKWALRCNPSSGNLHPTECYVIALAVSGIRSGLYHYSSLDHSLELRCEIPWEGETRLFFGLSSIHWREAWKYGERAFRYCQLDIGHALGALRYAAAVHGWGMELVDSPIGVLGTENDHGDAEKEEFDILLEIDLGSGISDFPHLDMKEWQGKPNRIDPHPMYAWTIVDEVANSTRKTKPLPGKEKAFQHQAGKGGISAVKLVLARRSAQRFDPAHFMERKDFFSMMEKLLPENATPWDIWGFEPKVHPVFFVHKIKGLDPGIYILPRSGAKLKERLSGEFLWEKSGPLYLLAKADCRQVARVISCRQAIASDSCFSLGMLAEFGEIGSDPWRYRQLHWEAGLIGHVLYLEAEASGLGGTGIGCFFDDAFHELLGIADHELQSVYHFTVGMPVTDERISTLAPYSERGE